MNNDLIKNYIDSQPQKVVSINWDKKTLAYSGIKQCQKRTSTDPEELTRAYLITKLVNELGYSPDRIEIEHVYTAGRPHTNTSRADVIVRDANNDAFLFFEVKNPDEYASMDKDQTIEEQLFKVAAQERAENHKVKYLVLYTINDGTGSITDECIIIDNERFPTYAEWEPNRNSTNTLPDHYGKPQKTPYIKGTSKDLEKNFSNEMLTQLQNDLHNVLWGGGGTDDNEVFSSLTNLILAKIQDEGDREDGEIYKFHSALSKAEIITKYREDLEDLCTYDKDTQSIFGFVNTWWVFGEVAKTLNYQIFMAEAENVGFKRSKRGEKPMPNDLFRVDADGNVQVDDGIEETILDYMRKLQWD